MRIFTIVFCMVAILLFSACSYDEISEKLITKNEAIFAQEYLQKLQSRDFDFVYKYLDPSLEGQVDNAQLQQIADYFPGGELLSSELIGSQIHTFESEWQGNYSFEYHFAEGWALATIVLRKSGEQLLVAGFHVYRTEKSQQELNSFSLTDKSALQYVVLFLSVVSALFVLVSTYFCIRTPIPRKKWLWVLFVQVGVGSINVDWSTGQFGVKFLEIKLFAASALSAGSLTPWIISASLPLGAIIFWFKRRGFLELERRRLERLSDHQE